MVRAAYTGKGIDDRNQSLDSPYDALFDIAIHLIPNGF